ncbi:hypothetical protein CYMTET_15172 [Cymbomonas tetramitiformis]|uniref:Uncharacterized protein n=1 Tax=Cymbomonas tetramitiformis TaxID=36881 RepID=A0AAE0L9A3_9CHLO|nr:hypothetical protein CYMTET_15172 [Cymbomonas tetramitiformis]
MQPENDEHKHTKAGDRRRFLKKGGKAAIFGATTFANLLANRASASGNGSGIGGGGEGGGDNNGNLPGGSGEWMLRRIDEGDDARKPKDSRAIIVRDEECLRIRILPAGWNAEAFTSVFFGGMWNMASLAAALSFTDGFGIFGLLFATPFLGLGAIIIQGISYSVTAEARLEIGQTRYRAQEKQKYSPNDSYHEGYTRDLKVKVAEPKVIGDNRVGTPREVKQDQPYYLMISDASGPTIIPLANLSGEEAKQVAEKIQAYVESMSDLSLIS